MKFTFPVAVLSLLATYMLRVANSAMTPADTASLASATLAAAGAILFFFQRERTGSQRAEEGEAKVLAAVGKSGVAVQRLSEEFDRLGAKLESELGNLAQVRDSLAARFQSMEQSNRHSSERIDALDHTVSEIRNGVQGGLFALAQLRTQVNLMRTGEGTKEILPDEWLLDQGDLLKAFHPGQIVRVVDRAAETETVFAYDDESQVSTEFYLKGTLKYRTRSSLFGNPLYGCELDPEGNLLREYHYDELGKLTDRKVC